MEDNDKLNIQVIKGGLFYKKQVPVVDKDSEETFYECDCLMKMFLDNPEIEKVAGVSRLQPREDSSNESKEEFEIINKCRMTLSCPEYFSNMYTHLYSHRKHSDEQMTNIYKAMTVITDLVNTTIFNALNFATVDGNLHYHVVPLDKYRKNSDDVESYQVYFTFTINEPKSKFNYRVMKPISKFLKSVEKENFEFVKDLTIKCLKSYDIDNSHVYSCLFGFMFVDNTFIQLS